MLRHGENFPVLSLLVPRRLTPHVTVLYAYCRGVDDLGDEAPGDRRAALDEWEEDLRRAWRGAGVANPILRACAASAAARDLPLTPYLDLIEANRRDQERVRFETFSALHDYCRKSADPVGRLYLALFGIRDPRLIHLSDQVCTGLQLVNFLQDIAADLAKRDRIYLPGDSMARFGVTEPDLVAGRAGAGWPRLRAWLDFERSRAGAFLTEGGALADALEGRLAASVRIFAQAGLRVLDALEAVDGDVWRRRPAPSGAAKAQLVAASIWWLLRRGARGNAA